MIDEDKKLVPAVHAQVNFSFGQSGQTPNKTRWLVVI